MSDSDGDRSFLWPAFTGVTRDGAGGESAAGFPAAARAASVGDTGAEPRPPPPPSRAAAAGLRRQNEVLKYSTNFKREILKNEY